MSADLPPLVLAYIGDAYFNLFVRCRLLDIAPAKVRSLHNLGAKAVSAVCQSKAYYSIESMLTDGERAIFHRGRNAKSHAPRSASVAEYHNSTGFEALVGFLYLTEQQQRLNEICSAAMTVIVEDMRL